MNKFKSRKFLTMAITNLTMVIFAALALYLSPEQMDSIERLVSVLAPLVLGAAVSGGYLSVEGRNDALDIVRQIEAARKVEPPKEP